MVDARSRPSRVVIAGGGVAGLEALIALRDLAGDRVSITLVAPEQAYTYSPTAVAQVFAMGHVRRYELAEIADTFGAELVCDSVSEVDPSTWRVRCISGDELDYDHLVLAVGARTGRAFRHGISFGEDPAEEALHCLLADLERGFVTQVAFIVPSDPAWTLPLYEIALMTARQIWSMGVDRVQFTLVTPEDRPLGVFGSAASQAVGDLLDAEGIEFIGSTYASVRHCDVRLDPTGRELTGVRVISLPTLDGPDLPGVPSDPSGFIPTDLHGRVPGLPGVYAAGDGTAFPIKQGGIATQQADAVAESIAAAVGAAVEPVPFRPVLRALLLTGGDTRFLLHGVAGGDGEGAVATHALWRPPAKIVSRYLTPYLFGYDHAERLKPTKPATSSRSSRSSPSVPGLTGSA